MNNFIGIIKWTFLGVIEVVLINQLVNLAQDGFAKNILVIGLCVIGIIGIPFALIKLFK